MVTLLKWIVIALLCALTGLHAALTTSLLWHMYRYDVPGAWISDEEIRFMYASAVIAVVGLSALSRYTHSIRKMVCMVFLAGMSSSFLIFLFLHLTDRLSVK